MTTETKIRKIEGIDEISDRSDSESFDCRYEVISEDIEIDGVGLCKTYGIVAVGRKGELARVSNVTTDKTAAYALVERCNDGALDATHLFDVVEDFVAEA